MLSNYASYLDNNNASPILLESFFKFEMENYILSGVIDRLDFDQADNVAIYDYKTSKIQKTKSQLRNSFQLPIYALAVYSNGNSMSSKISSYSHPIFAGELSLRFKDMGRGLEFSKADIQKIKREIQDVARQMSLNIFEANPNFMNCAYCDYKRFICSYYN